MTKRLAVLAALFAAVYVVAAPNPDPVRNHEEQFRWLYPQWFNQALNATFIDAGTIGITTGNFTTANASRIDAGAMNVANNLTVGGAANVTGAVTVTGNSTFGAVLSAPMFDGGAINTKLSSGLGGVTTVQALDAGAQSKVGGVLIGGLLAWDAGVSSHVCQFGFATLSTGAIQVTFPRAFASIPQCPSCVHRNTTNSNPCVIVAGTPPTTTTADFAVASGGSDIIDWMCCGDI